MDASALFLFFIFYFILNGFIKTVLAPSYEWWIPLLFHFLSWIWRSAVCRLMEERWLMLYWHVCVSFSDLDRDFWNNNDSSSVQQRWSSYPPKEFVLNISPYAPYGDPRLTLKWVSVQAGKRHKPLTHSSYHTPTPTPTPTLTTHTPGLSNQQQSLITAFKSFKTTVWLTYSDPKSVTPDHKTSHKQHGIFVAIDKNTLYGSKLWIFLLCKKSLGY